MIHTIKLTLEHHTALLNLMLAKFATAPAEQAPSDDPLAEPFQDLQAFLQFDARYSAQAQRMEMENALMRYGGTDEKDTTKRILSHLMSDTVAQQFSYRGRKGKENFSALNMCKIIIRSVLKNPRAKGVTEAQVEEYIKSWLAHATERVQRAGPTEDA
ncbi:uncharacterized protein LOC135373582 [Ornithodoros turicata]|uniref:uncharacterized protein LOC135373582 n=1 Tax=Ornithodoros turicata TaxID=34597 RepID=UPI0031388468